MLILSPGRMPEMHKFFGLDTQGDHLEKCIVSLETLARLLAPTSTEGAGSPVPPITPPPSPHLPLLPLTTYAQHPKYNCLTNPQ